MTKRIEDSFTDWQIQCCGAPTTPRLTTFRIDDGPGYEGYSIGHHWNGWACPYFTMDVAMKLVAGLIADNCYARYDAATDTFTINLSEDREWEYEGEYEGLDATLEDGSTVRVYPIGAYMWTWDDDSEWD